VPAFADPLAVARRLHAAGEEVALLYAGGPDGRRSLVAIRPDETIVTAPGSGAGLPAIPPRLVHAAHRHGVWIGAISYEAGLGLHDIGSRHDPTVPSLIATYHETYAVFDHATSSWEVDGPRPEPLEAAIAAPPLEPDLPMPAPRTARSGVSRLQHAAACREVQRLIALGEVFEVNVAHVLETPWTSGGFALFERLVAASPGDHSAYLAVAGIELASVSPELFLGIDGDRCETRPIKGTRRRGATPAEDEALADELVADVKDRAENVMIVDLLRNDLTATAEAGTVTVRALCELERTASVMHLVSSVTSRVREGVRLPDVLISCFPGGSVTGAPKRRAIEIIDRLETGPRGFYCGSVFAYEAARRHLEASIAIRTATVAGGVARYGSGGAVTLLSDPDAEAEETMVKARPFLDATNATAEGW
jgi:para-aminobenzoate synthetase component I